MIESDFERGFRNLVWAVCDRLGLDIHPAELLHDFEGEFERRALERWVYGAELFERELGGSG